MGYVQSAPQRKNRVARRNVTVEKKKQSRKTADTERRAGKRNRFHDQGSRDGKRKRDKGGSKARGD